MNIENPLRNTEKTQGPLIVDALKFYKERRSIWGVEFDWEVYIDQLVKFSENKEQGTRNKEQKTNDIYFIT